MLFDVVFPPEMLVIRLQVGKLGSLGVYEIDQQEILLMAEVLTKMILTESCPVQVTSMSYET